MLKKRFGAAPGERQGTAPEGIREKLERSGSTASQTERQASSLTSDPRSARRQRLVAHLHAAGPRPCLEALISVAAGNDLDEVLADFAGVPVATYRAVRADVLPIDQPLAVVNGGRDDG